MFFIVHTITMIITIILPPSRYTLFPPLLLMLLLLLPLPPLVLQFTQPRPNNRWIDLFGKHWKKKFFMWGLKRKANEMRKKDTEFVSHRIFSCFFFFCVYFLELLVWHLRTFSSSLAFYFIYSLGLTRICTIFLLNEMHHIFLLTIWSQCIKQPLANQSTFILYFQCYRRVCIWEVHGSQFNYIYCMYSKRYSCFQQINQGWKWKGKVSCVFVVVLFLSCFHFIATRTNGKGKVKSRNSRRERDSLSWSLFLSFCFEKEEL